MHSKENIVEVVLKLVKDLNLKAKLLIVTSNSVSNNRTLINHLHNSLLHEFNNTLDKEYGNFKLLM